MEEELKKETRIGNYFQSHYLFKGMTALENIETAATLAEQIIDFGTT